MKVIRYEIYDKRDRWMGGYSTDLDSLHKTPAFIMAEINANQCNGSIFEVFEDGTKKKIKTLKEKNK